MSGSDPLFAMELLNLKTGLDAGERLTADQLETVVRGFEADDPARSRDAAAVVSRAATTEAVWDATGEYLLDLLERAVEEGPGVEDLPEAACKAARAVVTARRSGEVDPPIDTDTGESLVRIGTGDEKSPWLTAAGTLLLSAAMDQGDYEPGDEIPPRIAEQLIGVSTHADGRREANLTAAGYGLLARTDDADGARRLVVEAIDLHDYLLRSEEGLREGLLQFVGAVAEDEPSLVEPYTPELAIHLRGDSYSVRRKAARAFDNLTDGLPVRAVRPGAYTLDGAFEAEPPVLPVFALNVLRTLAREDPDTVPERVWAAFAEAAGSWSVFTDRYGPGRGDDVNAFTRVPLFSTFAAVAPQHPPLADAVADDVFGELQSDRDSAFGTVAVDAGAAFAAVSPDEYAEALLRALAAELSFGPDGVEAETAAIVGANRFAESVAALDGAGAADALDELAALAADTDDPERAAIVGALARLVERESDLDTGDVEAAVEATAEDGDVTALVAVLTDDE